MFKHKRLKRYHLSNTFFLVVALVLLAMGIGYAAISTTLEIDGTSDIDSASWDIHFANVQVTTGSVSATTPSISNNTSVSFSANLANPGDFYEFTVDVVNSGTLDAKLDGIEILPVLTQAQSNYFKYTVTYADGLSIAQNDSLRSGVTETLLVRCEYLVLSDTSLYPTDDVSLDFSVSMTYIQGHGNRIRNINISTPRFIIGSTVPDGVTIYDNYNEAITAFGHPIFQRHIISNNIITELHLGFKINNKVYYIQGGGATYNTSTNSFNNDSQYYDTNKATLLKVFGSENCLIYTNSISCSDSITTLYGLAFKNGHVYVRYDADFYVCNVITSGSSYSSYCGIAD